MMKSMLLQFALLLACALGANSSIGQDPLGARPKKPRTPDDYKPRTLKEIAAASEAQIHVGGAVAEVLLGDILASRVRVTYEGSAGPLPRRKKEIVASWARRYAGDPSHYTARYQTEMLFTEGGAGHRLAVNKELVPRLEKEVKEGDAIDLYVIRLGGIRTEDRWEWVLLVETFASPDAASH